MMVSAKALVAIGLTLIIAVPIGMGYILSIDEEEGSAWETTSQTNISGMLLNNSTPYYGSYKGTTNNSTLYANGSVIAPNYTTVTSTYSPLPIYTTTTDTVSPNITTASLNGTYTNNSVKWPAATLVDDSYDGYWFNGYAHQMTLGYNHGYAWGETVWPNISPAVSVSVILLRSSSTGPYGGMWTAYGSWDGSPIYLEDVEYWMIDFAGDANYGRGVSVSGDFGAYNATILNGAVGVNGDWTAGDVTVGVAGNTVTVNGVTTEYDSAPTVLLVDDSAITVYHNVLSGSYADPSDGWSLPLANTDYLWLNNQTNNSITVYAKVPLNQSITIGDLVYTNDSGGGFVLIGGNYRLLGDYEYVQIIVTSTGYTIGGIIGWPSMGAVPTIYNSVSIDYSVEDFRTLNLRASSTGVLLRVDNANVIAGTFPSTLDYTLNLHSVFPNTSTDLYFNSIGVYGDSITIAGVTSVVDKTTGEITINGVTYKLLHMHITAWETDDGYNVRINGDEIGTYVLVPSVYFGGEWVITATAYKLEEVEHTYLAWHAGEFNLDERGFAGVAILTATALIVILGMTGARSMTKMAMLLLVCGGAALVAFIIV